MKTIAQLITELYNLHETRKQMFPYSMYQGTYEGMAIELNQELRTLSGRNYTDYTHSERDFYIAEYYLLTYDESVRS